jgi:hypothetical protein
MDASQSPVLIPFSLFCGHGLIVGATGASKTVTALRSLLRGQSILIR